MNSFVASAVLLAAVASPAAAIFNLASGFTNSISLAGVGSTSFGTLSGGSLALGSAFITPAGAAVGLLGAGLVGAAPLASASNRKKRSALSDVASLQLIDSYFMSILDVDVDDCGKRLVCEIRTLEAAERNDEESIISALFDNVSGAIDPLSAKAEYDIAAFIGDNFDKAVCQRRYHRCTYDRKVIIQALKKLEQETAQSDSNARPGQQ